MKANISSWSAAVLFFPCLCLVSPANAQQTLDAAATRYFYSPAFKGLVVAEAARETGLTCSKPQLRLEQLVADEDVVMNGRAHPDAGSWRVQFELEGCGEAQRYNLRFRANREGSPAKIP